MLGPIPPAGVRAIVKNKTDVAGSTPASRGSAPRTWRVSPVCSPPAVTASSSARSAVEFATWPAWPIVAAVFLGRMGNTRRRSHLTTVVEWTASRCAIWEADDKARFYNSLVVSSGSFLIAWEWNRVRSAIPFRQL